VGTPSFRAGMACREVYVLTPRNPGAEDCEPIGPIPGKAQFSKAIDAGLSLLRSSRRRLPATLRQASITVFFIVCESLVVVLRYGFQARAGPRTTGRPAPSRRWCAVHVHDAAETRRAQLRCGELAARAGLAHHINRIVRVMLASSAAGRAYLGNVAEPEILRASNSSGCARPGDGLRARPAPRRAVPRTRYAPRPFGCRARSRPQAGLPALQVAGRLVDVRRHGQVEIVHGWKGTPRGSCPRRVR